MEDPLEFRQNKCSTKAKKIFSTTINISFDLWYDKHYHDRHQHGDANGKRDGINPDIVEKLVRKSVKYLIMSGALVKGFSFINSPSSQPPLRVVLRDSGIEETLNVVIEAHLISPSNFEITVKTAMLTDEFRVSTGQYLIDFQQDDVILKKFDNKIFTEILNF